MKRMYLRQLLHNYRPTDLPEVAFKHRMLEFIEEYPNCFERTLDVGHITASAWLLNKDHTQFLLTHHAKLNRWFQLGGHCDGDYDVLRVAIREAQEESGIMNIAPVHTNIFDIDIHLIPANSREKEHFHYDVRFLLHVVSDEEPIISSESKALQWFGKDACQLPTQSNSIMRMFNKWVNQHTTESL